MTTPRVRGKPRRRAAGEGSVIKTPNGKYQAVISVRAPDGRRLRRKVTADSEKEAHARKAELLAQYAGGQPVDVARLTVSDWLDRWFTMHREKVQPLTARGYKQIIETHLKPSIGRIALAKLTAFDVEKMLSMKVSSGLSPRTCQYVRAVLRKALRDAEKSGGVRNNAAALADPPKVPRRTIEYLSLAEARAFLAACAGDDLETFMTVALHTGARRGELLGLRWRDVREGALTIGQSILRIDGRQQARPTKTQRARTIPISLPVMRAFALQRDRQDFQRRAAGALWQADESWDVGWLDLVFTRQDGGPMNEGLVTHGFKRLLAKAGIERPELHLHSSRHTAASLMYQQEHDLTIVAKRLGHSTVATTSMYYATSASDAERDASDRLGDALSGSR